VAYAGAAAPSGWLTCDGSEASRITYAALYAVLGGASSPYGQGNGTTTFNLPDLRSRTIFGAGTYGALGTGDQNIETNRNTQHQHGSGTLANSNTGLGQQTNTSDVGGSRLRLTSPDPHTHTITGTTSFQLGAANFPHLSLNFLIKT
jgi:microcystin-dependent protein